jgi:hypothetical protein
MTIVDTIADAHYGDKTALAMAFAALLNDEARELAKTGVDVIQFDEPAFNVYIREVTEWGIAALHRAAEGLSCKTAVHICYGYGIKANIAAASAPLTLRLPRPASTPAWGRCNCASQSCRKAVTSRRSWNRAVARRKRWWLVSGPLGAAELFC